jgi:hypothetical protein
MDGKEGEAYEKTFGYPCANSTSRLVMFQGTGTLKDFAWQTLAMAVRVSAENFIVLRGSSS